MTSSFVKGNCTDNQGLTLDGPIKEVPNSLLMRVERERNEQSGDYFFQKLEHNHFTNYVYLLKLHAPEKEARLDMLVNMYNNPLVVHEMHLLLKNTYSENVKDLEGSEEWERWQMIKKVDNWFNETIVPIQNEYEEVSYYDSKSSYVQGLRSILNDIIAQ